MKKLILIWLALLPLAMLSYSQKTELNLKALKKDFFWGERFKFKNNASATWTYYIKREGNAAYTDTTSIYFFKDKKIKLNYKIVKINNDNGFYYFGDSIYYFYNHLSEYRASKRTRLRLKTLKNNAVCPFFKRSSYFAGLLISKNDSCTDSSYLCTYIKKDKEAETIFTYTISRADSSLKKLEIQFKPKVTYLSKIHEIYTFLKFEKDIEGLDIEAVLPKAVAAKEESSALSSSFKQKKSLPDIKYASMSGDSIRLSSLNAQYYLLDLWYIGCVPCMKALPELHRMSEKYPYITLVGINVKNKVLSEVQAFVKKSGNKSIVLSNVSECAELKELARGYPTFVLLDNKLNILHVQSGFYKPGMKALEKQIKALKK